MPTAEKTNLELGNPNQGNPEPGKDKEGGSLLRGQSGQLLEDVPVH